jgi:serine/threonine protein kinase
MNKTSCGTLGYCAPEVVSGFSKLKKKLIFQAYDGFIADIWSAGVILFAMLSGGSILVVDLIFFLELPFDPKHTYEIVKSGKIDIEYPDIIPVNKHLNSENSLVQRICCKKFFKNQKKE